MNKLKIRNFRDKMLMYLAAALIPALLVLYVFQAHRYAALQSEVRSLEALRRFVQQDYLGERVLWQSSRHQTIQGGKGRQTRPKNPLHCQNPEMDSRKSLIDYAARWWRKRRRHLFTGVLHVPQNRR